MTIGIKTILTIAAVGLGSATLPAAAQTVGPTEGFAAARATGQTVEGYQPDGRLNVWGARLDPAQGGSVLGGVTNGVTGFVGNTVGGVVGGTVGAADAVTTGSIAPRRAYTGGGY